MRVRQHGPCWRVMETGHPSTRAVNSGSGNRALVRGRVSLQSTKSCLTFCCLPWCARCAKVSLALTMTRAILCCLATTTGTCCCVCITSSVIDLSTFTLTPWRQWASLQLSTSLTPSRRLMHCVWKHHVSSRVMLSAHVEQKLNKQSLKCFRNVLAS